MRVRCGHARGSRRRGTEEGRGQRAEGRGKEGGRHVPEPVEARPGGQEGHEGRTRAQHPVGTHRQRHQVIYKRIVECNGERVEHEGLPRGRNNFQPAKHSRGWRGSTIECVIHRVCTLVRASESERERVRESERERVCGRERRSALPSNEEPAKGRAESTSRCHGAVKRTDHAASGLVS